ncbi:hypothetical protein [Limnohabitans sp.]|uniref:hypothetical protein n=1 Tax=Limnohabitans sp. TaxID=1907725 RepID=UPI00286F0127|nr:hypothetical protein [Limnohabitans sp.]
MYLDNGIDVIVSANRMSVSVGNETPIFAADMPMDGRWHAFGLCSNGMAGPNNWRVMLNGEPFLSFDGPLLADLMSASELV